MEIDKNTLYYTLSAIPQILAATSAVLAAFIHFRLTIIHNILVGDGKATLDRSEDKDIGYILDKGMRDRLRDGIHRKSISEIKEILAELKAIEIKEINEEKIQQKDRATGLQYLFDDRFCPVEKHYSYLKILSIIIIGICILTIIFSVISLSQVDYIITHKTESKFLNLNVIFFSISILFSLGLVIYSFLYKTIHESTKKRDKIIKNK